MKGVLWVFSKIYLVLIVLRKFFYKIKIFKCHQLSVPVISVGNLTMGGVGKTPLIEYIAQVLKKKGIQPVILMRGYMEGNVDGRIQNSDEAIMLRNILADIPVLVGADRVRNAKEFEKRNKVSIFLLDDGFQHWPLARTMDIVAIDVTNPWGNGHLLPRGILREPKSALGRVHIFVLTKTDLGAHEPEKLKADLKTINPSALIVETVHKPVLFSDIRSGKDLDLISVYGQRIFPVCGIGDPDSFVRTLKKLGVQIDEQFTFMDHHRYELSDVVRITKLCQDKSITTIVTTEKDAVKLRHFLNIFPDDIRILSLKIKIFIINKEGQFLERISDIL